MMFYINFKLIRLLIIKIKSIKIVYERVLVRSFFILICAKTNLSVFFLFFLCFLANCAKIFCMEKTNVH